MKVAILAVCLLLAALPALADDLLGIRAIAQVSAVYFFAYEDNEVWAWNNGLRHLEHINWEVPIRDMKRFTTSHAILILYDDDQVYLADYGATFHLYCDAHRPGHEITAWETEQHPMFAYDDGQVWMWWEEELQRQVPFERENPNSGAPPGGRDASPLGAWPNPTAGPCEVAFSLESDGPVSVSIVDVTGRLVRELLAGPHPAGDYSLRWDGRDAVGRKVPAGPYFSRIETTEGTNSGRIVFAR